MLYSNFIVRLISKTTILYCYSDIPKRETPKSGRRTITIILFAVPDSPISKLSTA